MGILKAGADFASKDPRSLSMSGTNASSPLGSVFNSCNSLPYLGQTSTSHRQSPWNSVHQGLEEYVSDYVAFAPSPEPSRASNIMTSPNRALARTTRYKKKPAPAEISPENKWIFVTEGAADASSPSHRSGVRRGQLPAKSRRKARRIREIGACWKCWVQKVPCSEGEPCETCEKHFLVLAPQMCCRTRLHEYVPVFFPGMLGSYRFERRSC